jgi:hypothetical protein
LEAQEAEEAKDAEDEEIYSGRGHKGAADCAAKVGASRWMGSQPARRRRAGPPQYWRARLNCGAPTALGREAEEERGAGKMA